MKLGFLIALFLSALLAAWTPGFAQTADSNITFEVASVKPAGPFIPGPGNGARGGCRTDDPGRFTCSRATLTDLLTQAYDVWADQVSGPAWIGDRGTYAYAINATMPPGTTKDQVRLMVRNLLSERFHLSLHHETQARPGYELVVASGGPKLKEWTPVTDSAPVKAGVDANGFPKLPFSAGQGVVLHIDLSGRPAPVQMSFRESMAAFCRGLGNDINQSNGTPGGPQPRVLDKTGLTGIYEFTLEYAGTMRLPGMMLSAPPADDAAAPIASDPGEGAPNIFTAVEKQLGLRLVKVKGVPVDGLIIDNADKVPTEN